MEDNKWASSFCKEGDWITEVKQTGIVSAASEQKEEREEVSLDVELKKDL